MFLRGRIAPAYGYSRSEFQYSMPGEKDRVVEAFACAHCSRPTKVRPMCDPADVGGYCRVCSGLMCPGCARTGICDPMEAKLERNERRGTPIRSSGF